jgi:hypothetical protein
MRILAALLALVMLISPAAALDEQLIDPQGARWRLIKAEDGTVLAISMTLAGHHRNKRGEEYARVTFCEWDAAIANCARGVSNSRMMLFDCKGRSYIQGEREPAWLPHEAGSVMSEVDRIVCSLPVK